MAKLIAPAASISAVYVAGRKLAVLAAGLGRPVAAV